MNPNTDLTEVAKELPLLTIEDFIILLVTIFLLCFIAYLLTHVSKSIIHLFVGLTHRLKPKFDYSKIGDKDFEKYTKYHIFTKEVKKRNGVRLPFSFKRR